MTKSIYLLLLCLLLAGCAQNLTGTWVKTGSAERLGMKFNKDGSFEVVDLKDPEQKVLRSMTVKYKVVKKDGKKYIAYSYFRDGELRETEMVQYKIEKKILYLPRETEINGQKN